MEFWIKNAYDPEFGGFFSNVDQFGNVTTLTPQRPGFGKVPYKRKSLIVQSRHGYGFTKAFMLTGDEKYLDYAQSALGFLYDYGWDQVNDGWYCFAKSDGTIDYTQHDLRDLNQKWSFQQHYALLGIITHYEATHNSRTEEFMNKGINSLYSNLWDSRNGYEGYYEYADYDWKNKRGKSFTPTVDAITTNAESIYLITKEEKYKARLLQLADNITDHFIPQMDNPNVKALYPEVFNTDWAVDLNASKNGSIGHFLKTAWCFGRAYLCDTTRTEYKEAAIKILNQAWNYKNGDVSIWDHKNGGPFYEINILTGEWNGTNGNSKDYWTLEQGFTAAMLNYYITGDKVYLQMADEALDFFMNHFVDKENGEIFYTLDKTGTDIKKGIKGDDYKASYHSTEIGYYAYLYSSLYYLKGSAKLFYKFQPSDEERRITLTPIPIQENRLRIKSVKFNDSDYDLFEPDSRTLIIPPDIDGKFEVMFSYIPDAPNNIRETTRNAYFRIFPNPVKGILTVEGVENVSKILIANVTGKIVLQQNNELASANINVSSLQPGVYFIILYQPHQKSTLKIIKL